MSGEERGFFDNRRGRELFFAAHGPRTAPRAWLFCNPFLEEKTFSHAVYVQLARMLAARGEFVLRFDYEGDGDSDGEYDTLDLGDWVADAEDASGFVRATYGLSVSALFGLRLGATVAALAAGAIGCRQLLLWEPIRDGAQYLEDCLKLNLTTQLSTYKRVTEGRPKLLERLASGEAVDVGGYRIGARMAARLQAFNLDQTLAAIGSTQVDIVRLARRDDVGVTTPAGATRARVTLCQAAPFWQEPRHYDPGQPAFVAASAAALQTGMGASAQ